MAMFLIERNIDGASELSLHELAEISAKSNAVVAALGVPYRWITSYVVGDKIYDAASPTGPVRMRWRADVPAPAIAT